MNNEFGLINLWTEGDGVTRFVALLLLAGLQTIPADLYEAAALEGATPWQTLRRITLPLMTANALPGMANLWLNATKDTALLAVIGFSELTKATYQASATTKAFFVFYPAAMALYLLVSLTSTFLIGRLEKWARRGQRDVRGL